MEIPQEIRSKISQLDDLSREIKEWLEPYSYESNINPLYESLENLENDISTFQEDQGWLDSPEKTIPKPYVLVQVGDKAYSCETNEYEGIITWKGKASELEEHELNDWGMTAEEIDEEYLLVKVKVEADMLETILFNYDGDPCGVYVKIDE